MPDLETTTTPAVEAPPPVEALPDDASIADHEAQFGRTPSEPPPEPEKPRHRAKSQEATPADAPRIAELTKKWRDAERRAEEAERRANTRIPDTDRRAPVETPAAVAAPTDKPSWKTFEEQIGDKYPTWADAQDAYVDARDDWKDAQAKQQTAAQQQSTAQQAILERYTAKCQIFAETTPDFHDKMKAAAPVLDGIPDLLYQAIVRLDNGPEVAYYLVEHPSDLDDLCLLTDGKSVSESSVALLQRRLSHYRSPAAPTGSAAAPIARNLAPRPPNPVKTGPLKTGDELPGDESSLADHEKAFGPKARRR